jgi:hypothetical protein
MDMDLKNDENENEHGQVHGHGMQRPPALALVPVLWVSGALLVLSTRSSSQVPFGALWLAVAPAVLQAISAFYRGWLLCPSLFLLWAATPWLPDHLSLVLALCPLFSAVFVSRGRKGLGKSASTGGRAD